LGGGAWIIATSVALGQNLVLCRVTGGWPPGTPLLAVLTANGAFIGLATPLLRTYQRAPGQRERPWHEIARLGAVYMIAANLAALIIVVAMSSILPAVPSGHSFISSGRQWLYFGTNAVILLEVDLL